MKKTTARSHTNIAFIKYWGRKDEALRLPTNGSISMNLSDLFTTTTVEFVPNLSSDDILINGMKDEKMSIRVVQHLDRIRSCADSDLKAKVVSENNFPIGTGLSSSASGFAALTYAATHAIGLELTEKEISILARQGSGSACRSIPDGFVEWTDGETSEESYARTIFPSEYWDITDFVVVVSKNEKDVSSSEGQKRVDTSIFFQTRQKNIKEKITTCKKLIQEKNFPLFGQLAEMEALEMHAVMLTSWPPLLYWLPESIVVMKSVQKWRSEGLDVYFTINTGQDIHILCQKKDANEVLRKIQELGAASQIIQNTPSKGTYSLDAHLF